MFSFVYCGVRWNCVFGHVSLQRFHCVLSFTVCSCLVNFLAGVQKLSEPFLSLDLNRKWHFSAAIALLVGVSLFVAGTVVILRFASRRLLRALYWTLHIVSCVTTIQHEYRTYVAFCIRLVAPRPVLDFMWYDYHTWMWKLHEATAYVVVDYATVLCSYEKYEDHDFLWDGNFCPPACPGTTGRHVCDNAIRLHPTLTSDRANNAWRW